jgi:hypothetical protein
MKLDWKWILGTILILLIALPFLWQLIIPNSGYGTMMRSYSYHMPMMGYSYGMMPFGMILMWLVLPGTLTLIMLGIAWLIKQLTVK